MHHAAGLLIGTLLILANEPPCGTDQHFKAVPHGTSAEANDPDGTRIGARSEPRFSEEEARDEAKHKLHEAFGRAVADRTGRVVPHRELARYLPRLIYAPDVRREESTETIQKPYGITYRYRVLVVVPDRTLQHWAAKVARRHKTRLQWQAGAAALTVLAWAAGFAVAMKLDRWTLGYRRPVVVSGTLLVLSCGTSLGWILLQGSGLD